MDPNSDVPLYFQLGATLRECLDAGAWNPGSRFPTEREISEQFGVSRTVIRRAIELLVSDGVVELRQGSGAFISPPRRKVQIYGLIRALVERPAGFAFAIRAVRRKRASDAVARFLGLEADGLAVVHVTAVILEEAQPVCLLNSYTSADLIPWLLPAAKALQAERELPRMSGVMLGKGRVSVELTHFSRWGGPQLGANPGDPALMAHLIQFGTTKSAQRESKLEFAHLIYRADNSQLRFELG